MAQNAVLGSSECCMALPQPLVLGEVWLVRSLLAVLLALLLLLLSMLLLLLLFLLLLFHAALAIVGLEKAQDSARSVAAAISLCRKAKERAVPPSWTQFLSSFPHCCRSALTPGDSSALGQQWGKEERNCLNGTECCIRELRMLHGATTASGVGRGLAC